MGYLILVCNTGAGFQESRAKRRMMQEYLRTEPMRDAEAGEKAAKTYKAAGDIPIHF